MVAQDERYLNLLGCPGSNPLELFWDVVDVLDQDLEVKEVAVRRALDKASLEFTENTPFDEYKSALDSAADEEVERLTQDDVKEVYESVSIIDKR